MSFSLQVVLGYPEELRGAEPVAAAPNHLRHIPPSGPFEGVDDYRFHIDPKPDFGLKNWGVYSITKLASPKLGFHDRDGW